MGTRIRARRKQLSWKQKDLADASDSTVSAISQYELGTAMPSANRLALIAKSLDVSLDWLISGSDNFQNDATRTADKVVKVPLISDTQAGGWREIMDNFQPGQADVWIETTERVSKNAFALRVSGNSMQDANNPRSIPDGAIVIVDPNVEPQSGDIVVARLNGSSTVKKYVVDGGNYYLNPLNPDYRPILMEPPMEIVGVCKSAKIQL